MIFVYAGDDCHRSSSSVSGSSSQETASESGSDGRLPAPEQTSASSLKSYKLVGDNIDKEVRPRDLRSDHQTRSLHYFHTYAVKDRVDLSDICDKQRMVDLSDIQLTDLLPNADDEKELLANFGFLVFRVLKKHTLFFQSLRRE